MSDRPVDDRMLLGLWRTMVPLPGRIWQGAVSKEARAGGARLGSLTSEHHRVRDFAVTELPRRGKPLTPESIASTLDLPLSQVVTILDDLERGMVFLFRNEQGAVTWAYPVTVDRTPHRVTFGTGEQIYAA